MRSRWTTLLPPVSASILMATNWHCHLFILYKQGSQCLRRFVIVIARICKINESNRGSRPDKIFFHFSYQQLFCLYGKSTSKESFPEKKVWKRMLHAFNMKIKPCCSLTLLLSIRNMSEICVRACGVTAKLRLLWSQVAALLSSNVLLPPLVIYVTRMYVLTDNRTSHTAFSEQMSPDWGLSQIWI